MVDGVNGSKPKAIKQKGKTLVALSAVLLVAVLVVAFVLSSTGKAPENENGDDVDTSDEVSEDKLVSGVASEFILNQSDMGSDWNMSEYTTEINQVIGYPTNLSVTSAAHVKFEQLNSTGQVHYWVDVMVLVFDTVDNASSFYEERTEIHPVDDSNIKPEYRPSYPTLLANVSIGDRGALIDGPHITLGHEAKAIYFIDKNVVCDIIYHDRTSYDPLPNDLLTDLASKVESNIV
jgi:hypothetical protein